MNTTFNNYRRRCLVNFISSMAIFVFAPQIARAVPLKLLAPVKNTVGSNVIKEGRVKLNMPRLAETGDTVPVHIVIDSPMTNDDHVEKVYMFAEKNNVPHVLTISMGARNVSAELFTRIRLITSQKVLVVVKMNNDTFWSSMAEVEVTRADCG